MATPSLWWESCPNISKGWLLEQTDVWVPIMMQPQVATASRLDSRLHGWLQLVGRLKPGIHLDNAHSNLAVIASKLELKEPKWKDRVVTLFPRHRAGLNPYLQIRIPELLDPAGCGRRLGALDRMRQCCQSAPLHKRRKELVIWPSGWRQEPVGTRLIRYLLTETVVLFLAGGIAGILVAHWCLDVMDSIPRLPPQRYLQTNWTWVSWTTECCYLLWSFR